MSEDAPRLRRVEAFPVEHSLLAPAVGYRVSSGPLAFFYVPDLASIRERHEALSGVALYIGDGATVSRSMVRRRDHNEIGHAPIARRRGVLVVTAPAEEDLSRAVERLRHDRGRAVARVRSGRR